MTRKREANACVLVLFAAAVMGAAACGAKDNAEIISKISVAYENQNTLKNVAYSYQIAKSGAEGTVGSGKNVLIDFETGDSYSVESADGTVFQEILFFDERGYLKLPSLSDGWMEYEGENPEPSGWESLFAFPYGEEDIDDVTAEEDDGGTKVTVTLSGEALERYKERSTAGFAGDGNGPGAQSGSEDVIAGERQKALQTEYTRGKIVFEIDREGVLISLKSLFTVEEPELSADAGGNEQSDGRAEYDIVTNFTVMEYNSDEVMSWLREQASAVENEMKNAM